jgi:hypothetical protein
MKHLAVRKENHLFVLLRRILLPHYQMFHLFGVPSFVCTVKTYSSSSLPDVSSIWCTFIWQYKQMKVHQIDETSGSEEEEYVLTVQTNEGTPNTFLTVRCFIYLVYLHLFVLLRRILLPHCQMFHLFGVPSFVCTVKTYSPSSLWRYTK